MAAVVLLWQLSGCSASVKDDDHDSEDHHVHTGIAVEPEMAERFGIELETVRPSAFSDVIKTSGTIEASAAGTYTATAKKSGVIKLVPGVETGVEVKDAEILATISTEGLEGGDIQQAAQANLMAAKAEYERLKPLYEENLVTASVFREAERAYREAEALAGRNGNAGTSVIKSPTKGVVMALNVKSGEFVAAGTPVAVIGKNLTQVLKADLPAREARHLVEIESANIIPEGSREVIKLSEAEGKKISGGTATGVINGYLPVYFSFTGNPLYAPGGYAEVYLICGERQGVISVPRDALVEIQGQKYVYVNHDGHSFEKRLVSTGATDGDRFEILEGLESGERVVTKGASVVRMAEVSAIAPPSHTHNH